MTEGQIGTMVALIRERINRTSVNSAWAVFLSKGERSHECRYSIDPRAPKITAILAPDGTGL